MLYRFKSHPTCPCHDRFTADNKISAIRQNRLLLVETCSVCLLTAFALAPRSRPSHFTAFSLGLEGLALPVEHDVRVEIVKKKHSSPRGGKNKQITVGLFPFSTHFAVGSYTTVNHLHLLSRHNLCNSSLNLKSIQQSVYLLCLKFQHWGRHK